jgi:hypothetical protein
MVVGGGGGSVKERTGQIRLSQAHTLAIFNKQIKWRKISYCLQNASCRKCQWILSRSSGIWRNKWLGPHSLPQRPLHVLRYSASSFDFHYPLVSLKSSSSCSRLLPRLPITYNFPSIFPSVTCLKRQLLRKMWPIQLDFLPLYCT